MRKNHFKDKDKIVFVDVETPNGHNDSICSIGAILTDLKGNVIEEVYSLVNFESEFWNRNISIHGITEEDVEDAPTFGELWKDRLKDICQHR